MSDDASLGSLSAKIGLDTASLTPGVGQVKAHFAKLQSDGASSAGGLGGAFQKAGAVAAAGIAVIGVAAAAFALKSAGEFKQVGGEVLKLQRFTGGTAESMSKLRFAAQQSGVDADKLANSMKFLSKNVEANKPAFEKYGIATVDASGKTLAVDKILFNVADKFKTMPNGVEKTAAAVQIFGRAGADMIPMLNRGSAGLKELEGQAQRYGLVLTEKNIVAVKEAIKAHREHAAAMQGLQVQIGQNVLPILNRLTEAFTSGLLQVMPAVSGIINATVVPALGALVTVLTGTLGFVEAHQGPVKVLAAVIGAALVPALLAWAAAQAAATATSVVGFLVSVATNAVTAAGSLNLMSGSLQAGTARLTGFGVATGGIVAALGVLYMEWQKQKSAAKDWANKLVESAKSPEEATDKLKEAQVRYHREMQAGVSVLGLHMFATDGDAKKAAVAAQRYAEVTGKLKEHTQATGEATGAAEDLAVEFTKQGLAVQTLGGKTNLTADQVTQLAAAMKIDLTKGTEGATEAMAAQVTRLGATSTSSLRLADAVKILSDWTKDATEKSTAFSAALDALTGKQMSAEQANLSYRDALGKLAEVAKGSATNVRALEDAHLRVRDATQSLAEKEQALTALLADGKAKAPEVAKARQDITDATRDLRRATEDVKPAEDALSKSMDDNSEAGRRNRETFDAAAAAAVADTKAVYDTATAHGTQAQAMDAAKGAFDRHIAELRDQAEHLGMTTGQTDQLLDRLGLLQGIGPITKTVSVDDQASGPLRDILQMMGDANQRGYAFQASIGLPVHSAAGRIVTSPTLSWLGEGSKPEVVLPLSDPGRMRALIAQAGIGGMFDGGYTPGPGQTPSRTQNVTVRLDAPHDAGIAAQAELAGRIVGWQLDRSGRG